MALNRIQAAIDEGDKRKRRNGVLIAFLLSIVITAVAVADHISRASAMERSVVANSKPFGPGTIIGEPIDRMVADRGATHFLKQPRNFAVLAASVPPEPGVAAAAFLPPVDAALPPEPAPLVALDAPFGEPVPLFGPQLFVPGGGNPIFADDGGPPVPPPAPPPAAIPEPASWALMIAGFLSVGMALRVSRRRLANIAVQ